MSIPPSVEGANLDATAFFEQMNHGNLNHNPKEELRELTRAQLREVAALMTKHSQTRDANGGGPNPKQNRIRATIRTLGAHPTPYGFWRVLFVVSQPPPHVFEGESLRPLEVIHESLITCPECGHAELETMPVDACQFFYECKGCEAILRPQNGDCCVFCSFGSIKCPPMQAS